MQLHASKSVGTLKNHKHWLPSAIAWTHENTAHAGQDGYTAALVAPVPYPGKATRISRNGQWSTEKDSCGFSTEELKFSVRATCSVFWTEEGWNSLSVLHTVDSQQKEADILCPCYIQCILNRKGLKFSVRATYSGFTTERGWHSLSVLHTVDSQQKGVEILCRCCMQHVGYTPSWERKPCDYRHTRWPANKLSNRCLSWRSTCHLKRTR